jgi:hypothetical protein
VIGVSCSSVPGVASSNDTSRSSTVSPSTGPPATAADALGAPTPLNTAAAAPSDARASPPVRRRRGRPLGRAGSGWRAGRGTGRRREATELRSGCGTPWVRKGRRSRRSPWFGGISSRDGNPVQHTAIGLRTGATGRTGDRSVAGLGRIAAMDRALDPPPPDNRAGQTGGGGLIEVPHTRIGRRFVASDDLVARADRSVPDEFSGARGATRAGLRSRPTPRRPATRPRGRSGD